MPYPADVSIRAGVPNLIGAVWPSIPAGIRLAKSWGADWFEVSTPFVSRVGVAVVSHVGVIEVHFRRNGADCSVAGIHAVCTHPEHRGGGHFRAAMTAALEWIDARFETAVVWTDEPAIYEPFGFQQRPESVFRGDVSVRTADAVGVQRLSVSRPEDVATLQRLLRQRTPVSDQCAARDPGWHFLINLAIWPHAQTCLFYLRDLDCVVVADERDVTKLSVYDIVAREVPPLDVVLGCIAGDAQVVEVHVMPDRLAANDLLPVPLPTSDRLLVRGAPFFPEGPLALSPFIRT